MAVLQFACQAYQSQSLPLDAQQCINMFVERSPKDAKTQAPVFGCPGLYQFASCGTGPVYDMRLFNQLLYATTGTGLYTVNANGTATRVAGFTPANRPMVAQNATQIIVVDGVTGWVYTPSTSTLTALSGVANFNPARTVAYFDDYFILDIAGTNEFFFSALNDGTSYDALDVGSGDADPDLVLGVTTLHEQMLLLGGATTEFWWDTGAPPPALPFQRIPGTLMQRGMSAPLGFVKEDNTLFWLGDDGTFYRLQNLFPMRVSTHAMEATWGKYPTIADAFCFSYTQNGHKFIVLTFPSGNATWVLDLSTLLWHQRESWDSNNVNLGRWRGNCACTAYGHTLIGDAFTGQIGVADFNTYTEYGNTMLGLITSPPIQSDRLRVFMRRFELDVESGVGLASGQGSDPQVMLDWSDDGSREWSGTQYLLPMGKIGEYKKRLYRRRLGSFRNRVMRLQVTDPVRRNFIGFYADLSQGIA